jgi:hypothetical protein
LVAKCLKETAVRDKPRKGRPFLAVLRGDEGRLYAVADGELLEAVTSLRTERVYPAPLPKICARLGLPSRGKIALRDRLVRGTDPPGLAVLGRVSASPKLVLAGEEDFGRALSRKEQLDLRIRWRDLNAGASADRALAASKASFPIPVDGGIRADFATAFDRAYELLSRAERLTFVPLPKLRAAMPAFSPEEFDRGLLALCGTDRYQLAEHEHPARLSDAERAASLRHGPSGRTYHYVSKV